MLPFVLLCALLECTSSGPKTELSPFPAQGVDVFQSVFDAEVEITAGPHAGKHLKLEQLVDRAQAVARSRPILGGASKNARITFALPAGQALPASIQTSDFPMVPEAFRDTANRETIYLQITSLDAKSADGAYRIIAGEPLKKEFPKLFKPALGMVVSDVGRGFPARSFFVPYALIITPFGNLVSNEKGFAVPIFAQQPITHLPPYGATYADKGDEPLLSADNLNAGPVAKLRALSHKVSLP